MPTIRIPFNFTPRDYQLPIFKAIDNGYKRIIQVWHRRAGKEKTDINIIIKKAVEKVGVYYYIFPTYTQGRKILRDGIDKSGFRFIDHIPSEIIEKKNNQEMKVELKNGSILQVVGSDRIDSIVGTNPMGVVFSEYSLQNPVAWDFIRPILAENGGRAIFNFTPRGDNHAKALLDMAQESDKRHVSILTVDDTKAIPQEVLDEEKREIISKNGNDAIFQQEYYCSFDAGVHGSYYSHILDNLVEKNQVGGVPYDPMLDVNTAWDLGMSDSTSIRFYQTLGKEVRIIDYYENSGEGLAHYVSILREKGYNYDTHILPHDVQVRDLSSGKSRKETLESLGLGMIEIAPKLSVDDGIDAVRALLPYCWFDKKNTEAGRKALKNYKKKYNEKMKTFTGPEHDRSSHAADAFRYLAVSVDMANKVDAYYDPSEAERDFYNR